MSEQTSGGLTVPDYAMRIAAALPDKIRKRISWHEIKQMHDAGLVVVGRCRDCSAYQVNGDWAWCGEDNLSSQNANAPLSPDGYCSDYEPRAKTEDDK